ncbi:MAG: 3-deoxy-7-phosphoheptulonate synthase [Dehalococcoidales bacterium]|nr:3-deoxy-7-phosphoheptulonate synthase [Dehalococcoidales bacterium]
MIIMKSDATKEQITAVINEVEKKGLRTDVSQGDYRTIIGLIGDERKISFDHLAMLPGVKEARMIETPYKLISREYARLAGESEHRVIKVGDIEIGGDKLTFIAGPCAIESKQQLFRIAEGVKKAGAQMLRGGIFKPRSSVHSFQGLGANGKDGATEALSWLREAGDKFEMPVVTEVRGESQVEMVAKYVDVIQIGARNMYDQDLLVKVARTGKPILYKRHFGAGIEEFLSFTEYMVAEENRDIILCERGILPLGKGKSYTRYTLDLAAVPVIQKETYLPVIVDPSHAAGRRDLIFSLSCASVAAGACGLIIEVHYNPAEALVDGPQQITPDEFKNLVTACQGIHKAIGNRQNGG